MISQTLHVNVRGRPNSCCGSHEAPPPLSAPPPTQAAPHPLWTCNNKALINKVYFPVRQDRPGSPLCSTASATASVLAPKKKKKKPESLLKCLSHSSPSPLFLESPLRPEKKKIPPCLRATSQMFKRSQRGSQLSNTSPTPKRSPGLTPLCHRYHVIKARVGGSEGGEGTECLFVGDTTLQREETCCYSDVGTSVIRVCVRQKQENSPQLL